jgi:hypothetical protein
MIYIQFRNNFYPLGKIEFWYHEDVITKEKDYIKGIKIGDNEIRMYNIQYQEHIWWIQRYIKDMVNKGHKIIKLQDKSYDEYTIF